MNYSTEKDDYLMTTPYTKKIQQKFEKVKSFLEQNGFNPSSESLGQLGLVIEFESKFAAKKAFYSEVFQKYLQSRDLMELVTISTL